MTASHRRNPTWRTIEPPFHDAPRNIPSGAPFLETGRLPPHARRHWLVGLPAAWLLGFATDLDTLDVWLGLLTGLAATATLLLRRFALSIGRLEEARPASSPA
ncbi:hypothetical protein [Streptomyces himalayensis]|uniref:hypothetical protein n=1 Tax=Streptomyces himalayensis TaxID=2820085 RepID=UPI001FE35C54|nr:hypothetical protein [Streptomyces himalayensis]